MFLCRPGVVSVSLPLSIAASVAVPFSLPVPLPIFLAVPLPVAIPVPMAAAVMGRGFDWSLEHQLVLLALSWNLTHTTVQKTSERARRESAAAIDTPYCFKNRRPKTEKTCTRPAGWGCTDISGKPSEDEVQY